MMYMSKPKRMATPKNKASFPINALIGGAVGLAVTALLAVLSAFLLLSLKSPTYPLTVLADLCALLGGISGGFVAARRNGERPFISGICSCLPAVFAMLIVSLLTGYENGGVFAAILPPLLLAAGSAFGSFLSQKRPQSRKKKMKKLLSGR